MNGHRRSMFRFAELKSRDICHRDTNPSCTVVVGPYHRQAFPAADQPDARTITMGNEFPNQPGGAHLRTIAMPRDANASGDIFGGWTLSQMDLAGGTFAANHSGKRVVTVRIEAVEFVTPVYIGDDVSVFCWLEEEGNTSLKVRMETWVRGRDGANPHKVTEGVFTYVAVGEDGKPQPISS
jgi:acyl-CoA thioesterase YciA